MKFKLDENISGAAGRLLESAGHDASTVSEERMGGADDEVVADRLRREGRALITLDKDFCDVRAYPPHEYPGIVVIRSKRQSRPLLLRTLRSLLPMLKTELLAGKLWIAEPGRLRIVDPENI